METEQLTVRVCDCGQIAAGWAKARCGRDGRRNMRAQCPTRIMLIVAWEEVDEPARTEDEGGRVLGP
jgi:hypothetical protein